MKLPSYYGILKGYPRIRKIFGKLSDYLSLCRPFTLFGAFLAGFFLDVLFSRFSPSGLNLFHAFLVGLTLASLQGFGQAVNQSIKEEVEIDKLNKKDYRPVASGRISLLEGKIIGIILLILGVSIAFSLNVTYGLFSLLVAFFAVAYTVPPFRIKKYFMLNNLWQGIARGFLPAVYVASAYEGYGSLPLFFGLVLAVWITAFQSSKDFNDIRGDLQHGIKTFPVVLGKRGALELMSILGFCSFVLLNLFTFSGVFPTSFLLLNVLILPSIFLLFSLKKGIKSGLFENNVGWGFFYGTLGFFYILPALII